MIRKFLKVDLLSGGLYKYENQVSNVFVHHFIILIVLPE